MTSSEGATQSGVQQQGQDNAGAREPSTLGSAFALSAVPPLTVLVFDLACDVTNRSAVLVLVSCVQAIVVWLLVAFALMAAVVFCLRVLKSIFHGSKLMGFLDAALQRDTLLHVGLTWFVLFGICIPLGKWKVFVVYGVVLFVAHYTFVPHADFAASLAGIKKQVHEARERCWDKEIAWLRQKIDELHGLFTVSAIVLTAVATKVICKDMGLLFAVAFVFVVIWTWFIFTFGVIWSEHFSLASTWALYEWFVCTVIMLGCRICSHKSLEFAAGSGAVFVLGWTWFVWFGPPTITSAITWSRKFTAVVPGLTARLGTHLSLQVKNAVCPIPLLVLELCWGVVFSQSLVRAVLAGSHLSCICAALGLNLIAFGIAVVKPDVWFVVTVAFCILSPLTCLVLDSSLSVRGDDLAIIAALFTASLPLGELYHGARLWSQIFERNAGPSVDAIEKLCLKWLSRLGCAYLAVSILLVLHGNKAGNNNFSSGLVGGFVDGCVLGFLITCGQLMAAGAIWFLKSPEPIQRVNKWIERGFVLAFSVALAVTAFQAFGSMDKQQTSLHSALGVVQTFAIAFGFSPFLPNNGWSLLAKLYMSEEASVLKTVAPVSLVLTLLSFHPGAEAVFPCLMQSIEARQLGASIGLTLVLVYLGTSCLGKLDIRCWSPPTMLLRLVCLVVVVLGVGLVDQDYQTRYVRSVCRERFFVRIYELALVLVTTLTMCPWLPNNLWALLWFISRKIHRFIEPEPAHQSVHPSLGQARSLRTTQSVQTDSSVPPFDKFKDQAVHACVATVILDILDTHATATGMKVTDLVQSVVEALPGCTYALVREVLGLLDDFDEVLVSPSGVVSM